VGWFIFPAAVHRVAGSGAKECIGLLDAAAVTRWLPLSRLAAVISSLEGKPVPFFRFVTQPRLRHSPAGEPTVHALARRGGERPHFGLMFEEGTVSGRTRRSRGEVSRVARSRSSARPSSVSRLAIASSK
jgi:hypothetical protein